MDYIKYLSNQLMVREAIASVSLSHSENCKCKICRATLGDEEAFIEIYEEMEQE